MNRIFLPLFRRALALLPPLFLALLLAGLVGTDLQAAPVQVTDDRGQVLRWEQAPQRIVSLLPSLTETVCALGQCQRLVGVDRYSNWPQAVTRLPQVGGGLDPNIEAIVALRPDVVLVSTATRASARLQALGLQVVALEAHTHADVRRVLAQVAQLLGLPAGASERVWRDIDAALVQAAQSLPAAVRGTRVYFEVSSGPYAAGEASFIGETLQRLGARNVVDASLGPFPRLNPEFVVRANPDLIMLGQRHAAGLTERPGWGAIRAVREQRLCVFPDTEADLLVRPGPRLAEGARIMAACLADQAPGATDRPAPGATSRPAPGATGRPAPGATGRPAPGAAGPA